jgi:hypothetical protein
MRYKSWLFLLAALLLAACSKDSDQTGGSPVVVPTDPVPVPEMPESPLRLVSATRAGDTGISDAAGDYDTYSPIQIFLVSGTEASAISQKREGLFSYDAEATVPKWTSSIGLKDAHNCIYGFSPATAASCSISPLSGSSYQNGAVLTMTNLSAASGSDLCVVVGVSHGSTAAETAAVPERGKFYFQKSSDNYVSLLLDHVMARIDFNIKIGEEYSKRRFIKIKKLELTSSYNLTGVTVRLSADATDVSYTTEPVAADGSAPTGTLYDFTKEGSSSSGKDLSVRGTVFPGFFAPDDSKLIARGLSLICTYDVYAYDAINNKIGSRVREDCVAVNSLSRITGLSSLTRGKRTTINLTVEPTYLYQLSDDELDNPTISIDN